VELFERLVPRPGMNRPLFHFQSVFIHDFGKMTVTRLIHQNKNRITIDSQTRPDEKKISQVSAENEYPGALFKRGIQMLPSDNRNLDPQRIVGRFEYDPDFHAIAKKVSERPSRDVFDCGCA
jgi:hypothetical protein